MTATYRDLATPRGDPWIPKPLNVYPDFNSFNEFWCTVRKTPAVSQPDDTDTDVVGQVTLSGGGITQVDAQSIQITIAAALTRAWTNREYFYDVQARLIADGQPYTLIRGRLLMLDTATQTP